MLSANALLWTRVGALVALIIVANLLYALWKARRQASSIQQWLIVPGEIIACEVTAPKAHSSDDELRDGGVPLFALMLPIGCTVIGILGLRNYLQTRRKLQLSAKWPTAAGTIMDSEVVESQNKETDDKGRETVNTEYRVDIRFSYKVGSREFHSSNWKWGWTAIYADREKPEAIVAAYPVGKSVQVFYDPNEPATAVLEPPNPQGTFVQLVFSLVFGAGGLLMFWVFSKLGEGG
jgi:Protein of unknown function (DUF3592)